MNDLTLIKGLETDVEPCVQMNPEVFHIFLDDRRRDAIKHALETGSFLVALIDGKRAGYAIWEPDWFDSTFLKLVVVEKEFRRKGIASKLILELANHHCPTGRLFSSTEADNEPSIAMHKGIGFVDSGWIDHLPQPHKEIFLFKNTK
jgi:GNAT superfamily N-acetyltransferase